MRFAYLIMGDFQSADHATIHNGAAQIIGVADIEQAISTARRLLSEGVDCIELCGAFGTDGARKIVEATDNQIPIGYVTHLPEQEAVYRAAFSE